MTAAMEVHQVPEGSVVVLRGVAFDDEAAAQALVEGIAAVAGHSRFVLVHADGGGDVEVWGPDVDLEAKVRELLAATHDPGRPSPGSVPHRRIGEPSCTCSGGAVNPGCPVHGKQILRSDG